MSNAFSCKLISLPLVCAVLSVPAPLMAQEGQGEVAQLHSQLSALEAREQAALERVAELEARLVRLESLTQNLDWLEPQAISPDEAASLRGRYVTPQSRAMTNDPALSYFQTIDDPSDSGGLDTAQAESGDRKAPAPTDAVVELTGQNQGRFGDRLGFELGFGYTHFDNARINLDGFLALDAIFLGTISVDEVTADIFTVDPTIRMGLSDDFFLDASVPYLMRRSNYQSGGAGGSAAGVVEKTVWDRGLGDISVGAGLRLMAEGQGRPGVVLNARAKFPTGRDPYGIGFVEVENSEGNLMVPEELSTGTGVYGASLGLSAIKTLDPMVVFGSVNYFHNFERNFADIDEAPEDQPGRVNVGNAVQFGAGLAYALNDQSSISMSYSQRLVSRTRVQREGADWQRIIGSQANVALANLGATFALGKNVSLVTNLGIGLTDDSPDMALSIRLPMRF